MQKKSLYRWAPAIAMLVVGCAATVPSNSLNQNEAGKSNANSPAANVKVAEAEAQRSVQGYYGGHGKPGYGKPGYGHGKPDPCLPPKESCEECDVHAEGYVNLGGKKYELTIDTEYDKIVLSPVKKHSYWGYNNKYDKNKGELVFDIKDVKCDEEQAWIEAELKNGYGKKAQTINIYLNENTKTIITDTKIKGLKLRTKLKTVEIDEKCDGNGEEPPCDCEVNGGGRIDTNNDGQPDTTVNIVQNGAVFQINTGGPPTDLNITDIVCESTGGVAGQATITTSQGVTITILNNRVGPDDGTPGEAGDQDVVTIDFPASPDLTGPLSGNFQLIGECVEEADETANTL